jgi:hypothetical protein
MSFEHIPFCGVLIKGKWLGRYEGVKYFHRGKRVQIPRRRGKKPRGAHTGKILRDSSTRSHDKAEYCFFKNFEIKDSESGACNFTQG